MTLVERLRDCRWPSGGMEETALEAADALEQMEHWKQYHCSYEDKLEAMRQRAERAEADAAKYQKVHTQLQATIDRMGAAPPVEELEVRDASHKGRGIFATKDMPAGTVIEKAPLLYLSDLHNHVWDYDGRACIALGSHQLVNHDREANCTCECDGDFDLLIATRDIKVGEELTIDYIEHFGELGFEPLCAKVAK